MPALTYCVSASFCLAEAFRLQLAAKCFGRSKKARFPVGNLMAGASTLVLRTAEDRQASSISSGRREPPEWMGQSRAYSCERAVAQMPQPALFGFGASTAI